MSSALGGQMPAPPSRSSGRGERQAKAQPGGQRHDVAPPPGGLPVQQQPELQGEADDDEVGRGRNRRLDADLQPEADPEHGHQPLDRDQLDGDHQLDPAGQQPEHEAAEEIDTPAAQTGAGMGRGGHQQGQSKARNERQNEHGDERFQDNEGGAIHIGERRVSPPPPYREGHSMAPTVG